MSYNRSLLNFITKNLDKKPSKPSVPKNQWQHPGEVTKVNSPNITMDAVSYPVMGVPNVGQPQMMYPDQQYNFPQASSVTEFPMMAKGGYVVTRSNDRKGKTHKVTGPDGTVKYFGDSSMGQHPKDPERKKAFYARHKKNLAANPYFRAFARKTWEQGGELMQFGGLWDSNRTAWVDSVNNANMDKNFVQRMYNPNGPQMFLPGDKRPSTHFMESGDGRAYPTVVQRPGNKYLEWLNQNNRNGAYNYAANTGQYIQFPNDVQANWYAANGYKQGTNVVTGKKKMQPGGSVNNIWNAAKAVGNYMINQPDTNAENIVEVFDPFGASSWDDVIRSYNQTGMSGETGLELLGAVPFFGKLGKLSKPGIHLKKYQKLDKALYKNLPKNSILSNGFTGLGAAGKVTDAYQAYDQYKQVGGENNPDEQLANAAKSAFGLLGDIVSFPARAAVKAFTGKYQDPSQAMGITNPIGAFLTDAVLDPTNLVGAGLAAKVLKGTGKATKVVKAADKVTDAVKAVSKATGPKKIPIDPADFYKASGATIDALTQRGQQLDKITGGRLKLTPDDIQYHGTYDGRPIVEVNTPNGPEYFYKSTGWADKSQGKVTDQWQTFGQFMDAPAGTLKPYPVNNWFVKGHEYKNFYGSQAFKNTANDLDNLLIQKYGIPQQDLHKFLNLRGMQGNVNTFVPKNKYGGSLTKYQTQGEVYRDPEHKNPNISETGQKVINGISYLFDDVPAAINSLVGKAISPFVYNNITQKDKEELFKKYRPIDYPSVFKAIGTTVNNAFSSKGPKPVRYDDKGNLSIEEEAWRKALDLPTKANYIQESKYRPTSAKDPNAKYYTLHPNVIDPQKLIDYVKSGEWDKNKQLSKNGKDYYTQMSTFAPFIKESWKERQGIDEEDFKNIDPLQRFQMFKGYDPVKKKNYVSISDRYDFDFAPAQKVIKPYDFYDRFYYQDGGQKYTVKEGEYLSQIAKANNISVEDLVLANKISNPNLIKPNQEIIIPERTRGYSNPGAGGFQGFEQLQKMQEQLSQLPNDQMVKEYRKQFNVPGNYAMVDKKSGKMSIYDQSGKELKSFPVGTGKVIGDEYTINTTGPNRRNSTPAGIFTLTNKGSGRDSYAPHYGDNIWEMIDHNGVQQATALHQVPNELPYRNALIGDANPANNRLSNGCINCRKKDFDKGVEKFLGKDSQVYILPEDQNNYFRVKNNKLVLTGDNFNPNVLYSKKDLNARPLQIKYAKSQFPNSLDNVQQMAQSLVDNKQKLMKDLKIDNDTYNELTRLTLGMAGQESNYGDHPAYWYKEKWPLAQLDITMAKQLKNLANFKNPLDISPNSRGFTQIKYESQNKEVRDLFAKYGIKGPDDLANPAKSNIASLIMLGYMNNNELPQLKDKMKKLNLSKSDALLYLNQGKKSQITNMTATPQKNKYIRSVNDYAKRFVLNQKEQGGPVMGQEIEVSPDEMAELRKQGYKFKVVK